MSIESITGDDFMRFDFAEHREALALYDSKLTEVAQMVAEAKPGSDAHTQGLDKLSRLATLRKVHRVRLGEMEENEAVPATDRYSYPETDQLPH